MKKKLLGGLLVVAIAVVAAFNMSFNTQEKELSLLALANVEALANGESGTSTYYCCGNTGVCAKGTSSSGESIEIAGKAQKTKCD